MVTYFLHLPHADIKALLYMTTEECLEKLSMIKKKKKTEVVSINIAFTFNNSWNQKTSWENVQTLHLENLGVCTSETWWMTFLGLGFKTFSSSQQWLIRLQSSPGWWDSSVQTLPYTPSPMFWIDSHHCKQFTASD